MKIIQVKTHKSYIIKKRSNNKEGTIQLFAVGKCLSTLLNHAFVADCFPGGFKSTISGFFCDVDSDSIDLQWSNTLKWPCHCS